MNEMELQTTLDPIEMDMGDPEIEYSPVFPNPEGEPTDDLTKVTIQGNIYQIKDPEVHEWARAENKPVYTKAEVGLDEVDNTSDLDKPISTATQSALDGKVDNSELGNYYTKSEVNSALDNKADKSDTYTKTETDNLLSEKADSSSVYTKTETDTALGNKVDKVSGKGLSTNDYDDTAKGIVEGVTSALNGKVDKDGDKVLSDNNYSDTDKTKLDGIEANANHTEVDAEISSTSENPLQNKAIYDLLNDLLPEGEATGNPIAISNASGFNAKALTVDMLPIQDLHGYDKPWVGGSGKNKCNDTTLSVGYYDDQGRYQYQTSYRTSELIPIKASTQYTNSFFDKSKTRIGGLVTTFWDSEQNFISQSTSQSYTTTSETAYIRVRSFQNQTTYINNDDYLFQVEEGGTPTAFEPYSNICPISGRTSLDVTVNGETETLNLGQTVYGGTCDVVNGGTKEKFKFVTLNGTEDWQINNGIFYLDITNDYKKSLNNITYLSNSLKTVPQQTNTSSMATQEDKTIALYGNVSNYWRIFIKFTSFATTEQLKTWLQSNIVQFCYELATPITINTPSTPISLNKGNNTLSTSGDNMDLKYSTIISNPTSLTMARPSLGMVVPTIDSTEDTRLLNNANIDVVEEPTEE